MNDRAGYANADARLLPLADRSVHMIATSPPYWGLRSYDTGDNKHAEMGAEKIHDCLAWARGDEPCGGCYVCNMRTWAREMWRVLRDDGVMFLNLGDSYSNGMTGCLEAINHLTKGAHVFFFDSHPIAITAHSVDVTSDNQRPPQGELFTLLCPEREGIKNRDNDFSEVLDFFAPPRDAIQGGPVSFVPADGSTPDVIQKIFDCRSVILSDLNPNAQSEFGILRPTSTGAHKGDDTSLAIEESSKPRAKSAVRWHTRWDTFSFAATSKGFPDIDLMEYPVALRNGFSPFAGLLGDFRITKASEQQVTFVSIESGLIFIIADVRHLRFSYKSGRVVPYSQLYAQANQLANMSQAKQEMGIPDSVKKALQADGWICRSTIIWAKPNPMPESVTDRPTRQHEYIFLLTKSPRYFFDAEAVKEAVAQSTIGRGPVDFGGAKGRDYKGAISPDDPNYRNGNEQWGRTFDYTASCATGRNLRTVWNVATAPYAGAHFATWPPALVERMVKAGTSERGACSNCGAPWRRVVEKGEAVNRPDNPNDVQSYAAGSNHSNGNGATTLHKVRTVETVDWRPSCECAAATAPAIVLDPFCGSGTTLLVARQLGRIGLGFDLSVTYLTENTRARLGHDRLAAWGRGVRDDNSNYGAFALFARQEATP